MRVSPRIVCWYGGQAACDCPKEKREPDDFIEIVMCASDAPWLMEHKIGHRLPGGAVGQEGWVGLVAGFWLGTGSYVIGTYSSFHIHDIASTPEGTAQPGYYRTVRPCTHKSSGSPNASLRLRRGEGGGRTEHCSMHNRGNISVSNF